MGGIKSKTYLQDSILLNKEGVYGYTKTNQILKFVHPDSPENFSKNRKKHKNLPYGNDDITYNFNSLGHRSVPLEKLEKNYILFTGCSNTLGMGLPLNKTYPYLVSKHFDQNYYNLAISGSGNDMIFYNLSLFLKKNKIPPQLIVIQHSYYERLFVKNQNEAYCVGHWNYEEILKDSSLNYINYITDPTFNQREYNLLKDITLNYISLLNIPLILLPPPSPLPNYNKIDEIEFKILDQARDFMHPGPKSNQDLSKQIINKIKKEKLL